MNLSTGVMRLWRGYHVMAFTDDDNWRWEPDLAQLEVWLEENTRLPPLDRIEIYHSCILLVLRLGKTIYLERTPDGLKDREL